MTSDINTKALPGFMELSPSDQIAFNKIMNTIQAVYERFGFVPIDTPAIERSEVLLAKAGGETEKQIYRFDKGDNDLSLRFDLTVPLARYVSEHFNDITFPFRRYQISKVWRGERSQKGRYREFYQCDIDIVGNEKLSLINDAEIPSVIYEIFKQLNFGSFIIKISNRKLIMGLLEDLNLKNKSVSVMRAIDKFEKVGRDGVQEIFEEEGVDDDAINDIFKFIEIEGDSDFVLNSLKQRKIQNETFIKGLEELEEVVEKIKLFGVPEDNFEIDLGIARGLDYYTGTVYETRLTKYPEIGSVCSGGRYDNLASNYTTRSMPGVGISIGLTRLFSQLKDAELIKIDKGTNTQVLIIPVSNNISLPIKVASKLRESNVNVEIYSEEEKLQKKFKYADKLGIPFIIVIGEDEEKTKRLTIKDMKTGKQKKISIQKIGKYFINKNK